MRIYLVLRVKKHQTSETILWVEKESRKRQYSESGTLREPITELLDTNQSTETSIAKKYNAHTM